MRTIASLRAVARRLTPLGLAVALSACAADHGPPAIKTYGDFTLVIVNRSQFELVRLHVHSSPTDYLQSSNRLQQPLKVGESVAFRYPEIDHGAWYVTAVRVKVEHGALVGVTTGSPLDLREGLYQLWVFDESFRLFDPVDAGVTPEPDGQVDGPQTKGRGDASVSVDQGG